MSGHRSSLRLRGYDYRTGGMYFVTICVLGRQCLLGEINNGVTRSNSVGEMVGDVCNELPRYLGVEIDAFVVMPNHVHGIITLNPVGATPRGCPSANVISPDIGQALGPAPTFSLSDVVHRFKSLTTARYRNIKGPCSGTSDKRLWQRNYYERIIRNEDELNRIREYIRFNADRWMLDQYYQP